MPDDAWQRKIDDIFVAPEIIVALEPECSDCRFMDFGIMDGFFGCIPFEWPNPSLSIFWRLDTSGIDIPLQGSPPPQEEFHIGGSLFGQASIHNR